MVLTCLPGGWTLISMPQLRGLGGVLQNQLALAAAEHLLKGLSEILVDPAEFPDENIGHFLGNGLDDILQLFLRVEYIVPLAGEIGIPLVDPLEFLDGPQIGRAQGGDLALQIGDLLGGGGHGFNLGLLRGGGGGCQLVGLPELVENLLLLHGGGGFFLLQPAVSRSMSTICLFFSWASLSVFIAQGLGLGPGLDGGLERRPCAFHRGAQGLGRRLRCLDLLLQPGRLGLISLDQLFLLAAVAFHGIG